MLPVCQSVSGGLRGLTAAEAAWNGKRHEASWNGGKQGEEGEKRGEEGGRE